MKCTIVIWTVLVALAASDDRYGSSRGAYPKEPYFQYANVPSDYEHEHGYNRGNPYHSISRYEQVKGHTFKTQVKWSDGYGNHGGHYWDYNHGSDYADPSYSNFPGYYEPPTPFKPMVEPYVSKPHYETPAYEKPNVDYGSKPNYPSNYEKPKSEYELKPYYKYDTPKVTYEQTPYKPTSYDVETYSKPAYYEERRPYEEKYAPYNSGGGYNSGGVPVYRPKVYKTVGHKSSASRTSIPDPLYRY